MSPLPPPFPAALSRRSRAGVLALLACATQGCAAVLTTLGGAPPRAMPLERRAGGLRDVRTVVHCHSHRSHDSDGRDHDIADAARATGTDVVFLTDHPIDEGQPVPPAWVDGVLFVPGLELSKFRGSVLALGMRGPVDRHSLPPDLLRTLRERGAVTVLAHAELYYGPEEDLAELDAYEVYNLHADTVDESVAAVALSALLLPPGAFFRSIMDDPAPDVVARLTRLSSTRPLAVVAGNDSHANVRLFGPIGGTIGSYEETFRVVATYLLVPEGPLTEDVVLDAIRRGRTYVAFEDDVSAAGFRFQARSAADLHELGETVRGSPSLELEAHAPHPDAEVSIIRDGVAVATGRQRVRLAAPPPGIYRAEARLDDRPWVVTTGIQVGAPLQAPESAAPPE